jgi:hypothetical protein
MPRTDINEEEFLACARYGLMLAEENEDGRYTRSPAQACRAWLAAANELEKAASKVLAEISARP